MPASAKRETRALLRTWQKYHSIHSYYYLIAPVVRSSMVVIVLSHLLDLEGNYISLSMS